MNHRRLVAVTSILAICGALAYRSGTAAPPANTPPQESLDVRYARAQLKFAELTLQKAQDMNRKVPGTLIGGLIARFADEVEFAKLRLQSAMRPEGIDALQACVQRAELARRLAENRLKKSIEANQRAPGIVPASELERIKLEVEIAQLRVERGKSLADATPDAKLQWQLEMLNDDLARVSEQTYLLGQNRLQQF
jgi:hypothetical protein